MNTKEKIFNPDTVETIKGSFGEPKKKQARPSAADKLFTALAKPEAFRLMAVFIALMRFLGSPETVEAFRMKETDFTRERKLNFIDIVLIILFGSKSNVTTMLGEYWDGFKDPDAEPGSQTYQPVKSSFSEDRHKINPLLFERAISVINGEFNSATGPALFKGMLPASIDATDVQLGKGERLKEHFGERGNWATAKAVMAHNPLDGLFYALCVDQCDAAERDIFRGVWRKVRSLFPDQEILFLMDAGYPSRELVFSLVESGQHFVMRCTKSFLKPVNEAPAGLSEADLGEGVTVQVLKVRDMWGKDYTLVTDVKTLTEWDILWLYRQRWIIEVYYDYLKHRIGALRFTGRTPQAVTQDLYASVLLANLCTMAASMANDVTEREIIREAQTVLGGDFSPLPQRPGAEAPDVWAIDFDLDEEEAGEETIEVVIRKIGGDKKDPNETAETQAASEAKERPQTEKEAGEGNGKKAETETAANDTKNGKTETPNAETAAGNAKRKRKKKKPKKINADRVADGMALVPAGPPPEPEETETGRPAAGGRGKLRIENKWSYKASQNGSAGCRRKMMKVAWFLLEGERDKALAKCYRILHACSREKVADEQRGEEIPRKKVLKKPRYFQHRKLNL